MMTSVYASMVSIALTVFSACIGVITFGTLGGNSLLLLRTTALKIDGHRRRPPFVATSST